MTDVRRLITTIDAHAAGEPLGIEAFYGLLHRQLPKRPHFYLKSALQRNWLQDLEPKHSGCCLNRSQRSTVAGEGGQPNAKR